MYKNCKCRVCEKEFKHKYNTTFCSHKCRGIWTRDQQRARKNIVEITKECLHCKKEFSTTYSVKKFCSSACQKEYTRRINNPSLSDFWIFTRDNFTCIYCGKSSIIDGVALQVDHVYPFTKGGDNSPFNLVTACRSCNSSKGNKLLSVDIIKTIWMKNMELNSNSFVEMKDKLKPVPYEK